MLESKNLLFFLLDDGFIVSNDVKWFLNMPYIYMHNNYSMEMWDQLVFFVFDDDDDDFFLLDWLFGFCLDVD